MIQKHKKLLMNTKITKTNSLYIHFPFCEKICPYCDFIKFIKNDSFIDQYVNELSKDLDELINKKSTFKTIYIGGGTPSILTSLKLNFLLSKIDKIRDKECEFTFEANPESLNEEKLKILKKHEVNRISIGIQSFSKRILKSIDRDFNIDYFELINLTKKYIENINIDLIYGLENQTLEELNFDLENFIKLDVDHISIYSLTIYPNTAYAVKKVKEIDEEKGREFYNFILSFLRNHNYERYEVSNFARNKKYSKHNLTYWKNEHYVGLGVGASGYEDDVRYTNSGNLLAYLNGKRKKEVEKIDLENEMEYHLITNLRLAKGFNLLEFKERFGVDCIEHFPKIKDLIESKLLLKEGDNLCCSDEGILLLDYVLEKII